VNTTEELLARKSSCSGPESVGIRRVDYATHLYPQHLALTSPTSGGRSVGVVRLRNKATEFAFVAFLIAVSVQHFTKC
jgi:hypothetical protein